MKLLLSVLLAGCCSVSAISQEPVPAKKNGAQKVVDKAKQVNEQSRVISEASNELAGQARQTADNLKNTANNLKAVLKIFEPVLLHIFRKHKAAPAAPSGVAEATGNSHPPNTSPAESAPPPPPAENTAAHNDQPVALLQGQPVYGVPENDNYNADGTMNCGHQNNGQYGNCINLLQAKVVGMGEATEQPGSIDLIFFSQYGGLGYSFESPHEAPTINEGVEVKTWRERNETEIAETRLTIAQFEKIKTNPQLMNVVKNTTGFKGEFYTPGKMEGRVFAIKLQQDVRQLFALLAVYNQYGTSGSKGYLKIKIKVQGLDSNGDGNPDPAAYNR